MCRVWFLADTHFGVKNDNEMWLDDFTGYFNDVVIPLMRREHRDGDILVHLGDVFDNRSTVGLNTICKTIDIFNELSGIFDDIRIIIGNHDILNKSTNTITSVRVLERIPNIRIYYTPVVEVVGGKTVLFNPWVNDPDSERRLLASVDADYIFGHLDVSGCQLNRSGVRSNSENSIDTKEFKNSVVYAGHIHKRQDNKNVHYVGTPYQMSRNEMDDVKGITVLDVATGGTEFFENTYSPRFKAFSIYEMLDKTVGELKSEWDNVFVDLNVKGSDYIHCKFDSLMEELAGHFKEFSIHSDNTDTIPEAADAGCDSPDNRKATEEHIREWLEENDVDDNRSDKVMELYMKYKENL